MVAGGPWLDQATTTSGGAESVGGWGSVRRCKKLQRMRDASAGEMYKQRQTKDMKQGEDLHCDGSLAMRLEGALKFLSCTCRDPCLEEVSKKEGHAHCFE